MKLIVCLPCNEVFSLGRTYRECQGNHCGGQYVDNLNAKVWGDPKKYFVLGFQNGSFINAMSDQFHNGDPKETFVYGGDMCCVKGREFTAFVIPEAATSVVRVKRKFKIIDEH